MNNSASNVPKEIDNTNKIILASLKELSINRLRAINKPAMINPIKINGTMKDRALPFLTLLIGSLLLIYFVFLLLKLISSTQRSCLEPFLEEKETFVETSNCCSYIVGTAGEVYFSGSVSSRKATFECNQDFSDYLKDIDYGLYENDDSSDYNFQIIFRDESKKRTYGYHLYNSLKRIELSYDGQDEVGRDYSSRKDYSISAEDGQKIYDYVLNYVGVTIVDLPDIA